MLTDLLSKKFNSSSLNSSISSTSDQNCFCCSFIIFRTELAWLCTYSKYLIWWVLHALCNADSPGWSPDQLIPPRFFSSCCFPSQSPSWWRDFLLLPTKLMTLMRFISFYIAILVCFVSFLVLQNLNLLQYFRLLLPLTIPHNFVISTPTFCAKFINKNSKTSPQGTSLRLSVYPRPLSSLLQPVHYNSFIKSHLFTPN